MTTAQDVVVVGGGVIGLAVARDLAGDHRVTLVEQGRLAGGATGRAAGLVSIAADYGAHPDVAAHALAAFEAFDGQHGFRYHRSAGVERPSAGRGDLAAAVTRLRSEGTDATHVPAEAAAERYPGLTTPEEGVLRFDRGGWVVPEEFAAALADGARERGADLRTGVAVTDLAVDGSADGDRTATVVGVETDAGRVDADAVVVAAGWHTPDLLEAWARLPVRAYRTQCVVVEADVEGVPMGWAPDRDVYWRPTRDGRLLVGGGSHVTDDPAGASRDVSAAFRDRVASLVPELFEVTEAAFVRGWAGVDGATPDAYPIVDAPAEAPEGLVVATGLHGRGVMAAFPTAALVRTHLGGDEEVRTDPFVVDRFSSRDREFGFVNVSA